MRNKVFIKRERNGRLPAFGFLFDICCCVVLTVSARILYGKTRGSMLQNLADSVDCSREPQRHRDTKVWRLNENEHSRLVRLHGRLDVRDGFGRKRHNSWFSIAYLRRKTAQSALRARGRLKKGVNKLVCLFLSRVAETECSHG